MSPHAWCCHWGHPCLSPGGFGEQGHCLVCFVVLCCVLVSICPIEFNVFNPNQPSPGRKERQVLQLLVFTPRAKNR